MPDSIALYIHFPFCLSICPYCDFDRQATGFDRVDAYLDAVAAELRASATGDQVHSVFFGGGTPSLMRPDQVARLLDTAGAGFQLQSDAEVTLEANPGDADLAKFHGFRGAGVNRVSLGVQSLDDPFLVRLGRRHTAAEAGQAATWAHEAGLDLNLDFMYGLPGQSLEQWEQTLRQAVALEPGHLSCYLLTLDEKVPMGRDVARGRITLPEDDEIGGMYDRARDLLAETGYRQYEISNWARPGHESRHNLTYWRDGTWIGVGAGAASSFNGRRWKNTPALERYIRSMREEGQAARVELEEPDLATRVLDFVTLGLRLREGIFLPEFRRRFGSEAREVLAEEAAWMLAEGILEREGDRLRIAADRQLITNELLVRLTAPIEQWAAAQERRMPSAPQSATRCVRAGSAPSARSSAASAAR